LPSVELIIFDCDGVLVDSELLANNVLAKALQDLGLPYDTARTIDSFMGRSLKSCFEQIERELGASLPNDFGARLDRDTYLAFEQDLQSVPFIATALDQIQAHYKSCVASSGSHEKMQLTLGKTGLFNRFENRIFSASEVKQGKPKPDLFLHAAARMGVLPTHCVVIEDSPAGVQAAKAAGMQVLGYCAMTPREKLESLGAIGFDDMRELFAMIGRLTAT
jgi:HAD superfamily hydrolase (TIGR01509 family)